MWNEHSTIFIFIPSGYCLFISVIFIYIFIFLRSLVVWSMVDFLCHFGISWKLTKLNWTSIKLKHELSQPLHNNNNNKKQWFIDKYFCCYFFLSLVLYLFLVVECLYCCHCKKINPFLIISAVQFVIYRCSLFKMEFTRKSCTNILFNHTTIVRAFVVIRAVSAISWLSLSVCMWIQLFHMMDVCISHEFIKQTHSLIDWKWTRTPCPNKPSFSFTDTALCWMRFVCTAMYSKRTMIGIVCFAPHVFCPLFFFLQLSPCLSVTLPRIPIANLWNVPLNEFDAKTKSNLIYFLFHYLFCLVSILLFLV